MADAFSGDSDGTLTMTIAKFAHGILIAELGGQGGGQGTENVTQEELGFRAESSGS